MTLITIVTTTFNSEKYLRDTIESVLSQKGDFTVEYIIVDAGSTDKTTSIVKEYPSIIFYSYPKSSMYEAINLGFKKGSGDLLAWINSDDLYAEGAFKKITDEFVLGEYKIISGNTIYIDEIGSKMYKYNFLLSNARFLKSTRTLFLAQPSTFFDRKTYFNIGGLDLNLRYNADRDLFLRYLEVSKIKILKEVISNFRVHGANFSTLKKSEMVEEDEYINNKLQTGVKSPFRFIGFIGTIITKMFNFEMIYWKIKNRKTSTF